MVEKVSEFAGRRRREPEPGSVPAQDQPSPVGSGIGDFQRGACGECWHWKRQPRAGLDIGTCMLNPPFPFPTPQGQVLVRPTPKADSEGCDQWDDDTGEDGGGEDMGQLVAAEG